MGSAGSGKSTLAKELRDILDLEVIHLDAKFHKENWNARTKEEQIPIHDKIMEKSNWIVEGNWTATINKRIEDADMVVYLNFNLFVCLYRIIKRFKINKGTVRDDSAEGCVEKLDFEFINYVIYYHLFKKKIINKFLKLNVLKKPLVIINSKKEKGKFLNWIVEELLETNIERT